MTDAPSSNELTPDDVPEYRRPRGEVMLDDLPLDPTDGRALDRELNKYPDTGLERDLKAVAGNIRSAIAAGQKNLRQTTQRGGSDLQGATINPNQEMVRNPGGYPSARRAKTHQRNLKTNINRFADLCEQYFRRVRSQFGDTE